MTTLLRIDASARVSGSLSRGLADRFFDAWAATAPADRVLHRDVGQSPPPAVSDAWIAAAFTPPEQRTADQQAQLALSDQLIDELAAADVLVIATPMYNYGMPSALKAWVDMVIRINRTFTFDLARGDFPLEPTMSGKTMVALTASGEFGYGPGQMRARMDHLVPHLRTVAHYFGVSETFHTGIEYQEFGGDAHRRSIETAKAAVTDLVDELQARLGGRHSAQGDVGRALADADRAR